MNGRHLILDRHDAIARQRAGESGPVQAGEQVSDTRGMGDLLVADVDRAGTVIVTLPWPPYNLSQNGQHGHYRAHQARKDAYKALALEAIEGAPVPSFDEGDIRLTVHFHPPTITRPDLDNALTRLKAGIDALSAAWGVNDNRFEYDLRHGAKVKGGRVIITVGAAQ